MSCCLRRRGPGEEYLRNALRDIIVELSTRTDSLEINPIKVGID